MNCGAAVGLGLLFVFVIDEPDEKVFWHAQAWKNTGGLAAASNGAAVLVHMDASRVAGRNFCQELLDTNWKLHVGAVERRDGEEQIFDGEVALAQIASPQLSGTYGTVGVTSWLFLAIVRISGIVEFHEL